MVAIQTTVGLPTFQASGSAPNLRGDSMGGLVVSESGMALMEATRAGQMFSASTINTGVTIASLTLTTSAPTALANPSGSGVNLYLKSITMGYVSGTLGTGQFFLVGHPNSAAVTGTAATYINNNLVGNTAAPRCNATYTSTVAAGGKVVRNLWISTPFLATSVFAPPDLTIELNGSVGVAPGSAVSVQGITAAGSSPLAVFTWTWMEVAIS